MGRPASERTRSRSSAGRLAARRAASVSGKPPPRYRPSSSGHVVEPQGRVVHVADARAGRGGRCPVRSLRAGQQRPQVGHRSLRRGRGGGHLAQAVQVHVFGHDVRHPVQPGHAFLVLHAGDEAHVPLGDGVVGDLGQHAQHRHVGVVLDGFAQHGAVAHPRRAVQDHPRDVHVRLEVPQPGHDGGRRAGHLGAVHDHHHWRAEDARQFRRGTAAGQVPPVEQPPVALDDGDVIWAGRAERTVVPCRAGQAALRPEQRAQHVRIEEIGVQVGGGVSGGQGQPPGVDVVRPLLAGFHRKARARKGAHDAKGYQRLARAAGKSGDDDARKVHAANAPGRPAGVRWRKGGRRAARQGRAALPGRASVDRAVHGHARACI